MDVDKGSVEDEGGPTHSNIDVIFALGPYAVVNADLRAEVSHQKARCCGRALPCVDPPERGVQYTQRGDDEKRVSINHKNLSHHYLPLIANVGYISVIVHLPIQKSANNTSRIFSTSIAPVILPSSDAANRSSSAAMSNAM